MTTVQRCPQCGASNPEFAPVCAQCGRLNMSADPLIGRTIGAYRILSVIGAGGMGRVYKAQQTRLQRTVCVKVLLPEFANDPVFAGRFEREGVATANLHHPNIVSIFDSGRADDGTLFIAMEYVEARTLTAILRDEAPTTAARAITLIDQVLSALDEAHANGVVHRDLKPANVLVAAQRNGTELVKVVDFGIAKLVGNRAEEVTGLTSTGMVLGSMGYMAPEQLTAGEIGAPADVYVVGVLLWELLTGRRLFTAGSALELAQKHIGLAPESPSAVSSLPISPRLDEVVLRALEKSADRRFHSAADFKHALAEVRAELEGRAGPKSSEVRSAADRTPLAEAALSGLRGLVPDQLLAYATELPRHVVATEKRLLTVAHAELSGQSSLSECMDGQALKQLLASLTEEFTGAVHRREGQLERLPGVGFVVVFGLLRPHEDDPARAVSACFELQAALARINRRLPKPLGLRIGLHAAMVTSAHDEHALSESLGVAEVSAVARRLLSTVPAGAILASRAVERLVRAVVETSKREVTINGQPLEPVYELLGPSDRSAARQALVGRSAETDALRAVLDSVRQGKPAGVLLVGAPGLGKSRMLAEAAALARAAGATVMTARGGRSFGDSPFDVARQLVQSLLTNAAAAADATSYRGLSAFGVSAFDVSRVETLLSGAGKSGAPAGSSREDDAARDRASLLTVFDRIAARRPMVLLVDDHHLADDVSKALFEDLQGRARAHPFGLIATARPGDLGRLTPRLRRVELARFDLPTSRAMIGSLLGGQPSEALLDLVSARADGNPFFIQETVHSLVESSAIQQVGAVWELVPGASETVPDSLAMVVSARVERVSVGARALLRIGAVIGRTFSAELAAAASPEPVNAPRDSAECVRRGLLAETDQPGIVRFEHSVVHEVMLQRLTSLDLTYLHQRVAEALERTAATGEVPFEVMAKHFLAAQQPRKALRYLRLAAERHFERGLFARAVDDFRQCLGLMQREAASAGPVNEQTAVQLLGLVGRAMAAQLMVSPEQAVELFASIVPGLPPAMGGPARAEPLRQLGLALLRLSRLPKAEVALRDALAMVSSDAATLAAHIRSDLANVLEAKGDLGGATAVLLEGLGIVGSKKVKDDQLLWQYLNGLGRLHLRAGKAQPAEEFFQNARDRARAVRSGIGESTALANLAVARAERGDAASALALSGEALDLAEKAGDRLGVLRVRYNRARLLVKSNAVKAAADLEAVVEGSRDIGWREGEGLAAQALAQLTMK